MASVSSCLISRPFSSSHLSFSLGPLQFQFPRVEFHTHFKNPAISCTSSKVKFNGRDSFLRPSKLRAAAEDVNVVVEEQESSAPPDSAADDQTVSVAVSSSDMLTMFFQAEGTMADSAIPAVSKALEELEGITDLKVQVLEGIASVELTKQTTIQATGVASNLVETIQGSGFKLQTLNLSFQDEEDFS